MILDSSFCTKCGCMLKEDDMYCPECGAPQFTAAVDERPNYRYTLISIVSMIIGVAVAFFVSMLGNVFMMFILVPFLFIRGRRKTVLGSIVGGLILGFLTGLTAAMICKFAGVAVF